MKLSNCIKTMRLFFYLLSASHVCAIVPHSPTDSYNTAINDIHHEILPDNLSKEDIFALAEQRQDILENILKSIINTFQKIDVLLEDLALEVHNNVIKADDKTALMTSLKECRALIQQLKDNAFVEINEFKLHILLQFTQAFLNHLTKALNNGFATLPSFEMSQVRSRSIDDDITPADLYQNLAINNKSLIRVQNLAKKAGLTWYNKQYARLDKYIIQPCQKYKIPKRLAQATALGSVGIYLWYQSESENPLMRKILGYPPRIQGGALVREYHGLDDIDEYSMNKTVPLATSEQVATLAPADSVTGEPASLPTQHTSEQLPATVTESKTPFTPKPLKTLGQLDYFFIKISLSQTPLLSLGTPLLLAHFKDELSILKAEIGKKITYGINFLKGGAHRLKGDGVTPIQITKTFDDLIGLEETKNIIGETILKYLEDPERLARKKLTPEKGYLFYGPPGTGKSEFANALCGEIKARLTKSGRDFKYLEINPSIIVEKGIGYIMEVAQQHGPCVLFIDEIDSLGLQRVGGNPFLLHDFLTSMSGSMDSDPKKQVIILAATNKPEKLDAAMLRTGRFGKQIYFDYPSYEYRKEFLIRRLNDISANLDFFDIEKLAYESDGCSYEDLNAIIKGALQNAQRFGIALTQEQLDHAFDKEIRKILVDDKHISLQEKQFIATYQAGTALAHILLNAKTIIAKVTIHPVASKIKEDNDWLKLGNNQAKQNPQDPIEYGKIFVYKKNDPLNLKTTQDAIIDAKILLAGSIAQEILLGSKNINYRPQDKQLAWSVVQGLVFDEVASDQLSSDQKNKLLDRAHAQRASYEQEVRELLEQNKGILQALSEQLQEKSSLTGKEISDIINK